MVALRHHGEMNLEAATEGKEHKAEGGEFTTGTRTFQPFNLS